MENYSVTFLDPDQWYVSDKNALMQGIDDYAQAVANLTGTTPVDAFSLMVGNLRVKTNPTLKKWHALVLNGVPDLVQFKPGLVTAWLAVHEIGGHIVNDNVPNSERPAELLSIYGVKTPSGKMVTGPCASGYCRDMHMYPEKNGYLYYGYPWQQHPRKEKDGDTPLENFADMILSWVYQLFANNEAGYALTKWCEDYISGRIIKALWRMK